MQLIINGTHRAATDKISLLSLLEELKINPATIVVELNREVVPKNAYADITLADGDKLELVRFVGGG